MNSCNFIGRVIDDPKRVMSDPERCYFSISVRRGGGIADYLDFTAWGSTATYIMSHFEKNDMIAIENARAEVILFTDGAGNRKRKVDFVVGKAYMWNNKQSEDAQEEKEDISDNCD